MKQKIIRITTVPGSLLGLLKGQLQFMSEYFDIIGISSSGEGLLEEMGKFEKVKTIPVEMTRKITPIQDLIAVYKLYKILKKEKPLIVHSHTPKAGTLGMLAAKLAGVPHRLHTIAGLPLVEAKGLKRILLNAVEKITYKCANKIYPNSYGLKDIILDNNFTKEDNLKVIGNGSSNGIDTNHFNKDNYDNTQINELRESLGIKLNDFVFIFVGRLVKDKGINELIDAFNLLSSKNNTVKLLLVGKYEDHIDPLKRNTTEIIDSNRNVISVGWQDDVRPYFAISNALTFPSYREGFPNVVLQAGAMRLPCIVSDINGCNEIVTNNENGLIIPVKDKNSIYQAMTNFLSLPQEKLTEMGNISRQKIVTNYDQKFVWNSILNVYKSVISKN